MMQEDNIEVVLKPPEVARLLRVDVRTVKRWLAEGVLKGFRTPGGHWRCNDPDILALWESNHALKEGGT